MLRRRAALLAFGALLLGSSFSAADDPARPATAAAASEPHVEPEGPEIAASVSSYLSQGKPITVERFEPRDGHKHPAVMIVHGSGGLFLGRTTYRETARQLARKGYVAHLVHYFDLTGTHVADLPTMRAHFASWLIVLADGLTNLSKQPNVDPDRIGMVGYSLGGFLSVSVALFDARVGAVVEYFGGLPVELHEALKSLPPTLILHGDADKIVPLDHARALEKLCLDKKITHEVRVYPGQGHFFFGDDGVDAAARTYAFLDRYLKTKPVRHEVSRPRFDLLPGNLAEKAPPAAFAGPAETPVTTAPPPDVKK